MRRPFSKPAALPTQGGLDALRGTLMDRAQGAASEAAVVLGPRLEAAREAIAPRIEGAMEALAPRIEGARETITPKVEAARDQAVTTVRDQVAPRVAKTLSTAMAASGPVRDEAKHRGEAAIAALRGELPAKKRRWPRALLLLGAGAAAGAAAGLVTRRREPAYPSFESYPPVSTPDPYAQPEPGSAEPARPVGGTTDALPASTADGPDALPGAMTGSTAPERAPAAPIAGTAPSEETPTTAAERGEATIDVTEPVATGAETDAPAKSARRRKRTADEPPA